MRALDIVLIHPGSRARSYQSLGETLAAIEPPVWTGLLASFARTAGLAVEIIDANAEGLTPEETAERVAAMGARLVALIVYGHQPSASTQTMPAAGCVARAIKALLPEQRILMIGGHVAALPERTLAEESVDFVCTGEGPYTLVDLVHAIRGSGSPDWSQVRGLGYWRDGVIALSDPAPLVQDLDGQMRGIAWDRLPMDRYRAHNWHTFGETSRQPYASLYTTFGCPYRCTFCCIQAPFKSGERSLGLLPTANSYRRWKPDTVLDELEILVERYGVRHLKIADELFVLHPGHVEAICDGIIERQYDLNIWAYARVDTIRLALVDKLRRAGVRWLAFGIEAADANVRDEVQKGFDQKRIVSAIDAVRAAGIHVIGNYIFGLPEDDRTTMQATLDMALDLRCEFANFYCTMAYPGSALYTQAQREGWALPETWDGYAQHAVEAKPLPTRHLTAGDVLAFRDRAFHTYFGDASYLHMIEAKFGASTRREIAEMASHRLERRFA